MYVDSIQCKASGSSLRAWGRVGAGDAAPGDWVGVVMARVTLQYICNHTTKSFLIAFDRPPSHPNAKHSHNPHSIHLSLVTPSPGPFASPASLEPLPASTAHLAHPTMSQDWWPTSSTSFSTPSRPQAHPSSGFTSTPSTHALGGPVSSSTAATNSNTAGPLQPFGSTSGRARFAGDELDPEDSKSAENVKFFPSFSSTPAGKAYQASGGVIAGGGGGSVGSPGAGGGSPGVRRSPQHRFSFGTSPNDA